MTSKIATGAADAGLDDIGVRASHDPWGGTSLEWLALSPPPPHNFDLLPDVRSHEPLRDIRDAIARQGADGGEKAAESQPVA